VPTPKARNSAQSGIPVPPAKTPAHGFLAERTLRRYARVGHLWALGVGAVI